MPKFPIINSSDKARSCKPTFIYALVDPTTSECRYVGKTINLEKRYGDHKYTKYKTKVSCWARSLKPLKPELAILEIVPPGGDWVEAEQFWIAYMKGLGARLCNHSDGGEGNLGLEHRADSKAKISASLMGNQHLLNHQVTEETRAKLSEAGKLRKHTEEGKLKIALANTGVVFTEERLRKMSESQLGHKRSNESIEKQKETVRNRTEEEKAITSAKITKALTGGKRTDETRAKMSASAKALPPKSTETCAKISASKKDKPVSEETKAKISLATKGKPKSEATVAKMRKPKSAEHKQKLSEATKRWWLCN